MSIRNSRGWLKIKTFCRRFFWYLVVAAMSLVAGVVFSGHYRTAPSAAARPAAPPSVQPSSVTVQDPSLGEHSAAGASRAAFAILQNYFGTLLMTPPQRQAVLPELLGVPPKSEIDRMNAYSPNLEISLGLTINADNRAAAYFYVSQFGAPRVLTYSPLSARIALITTSSAGTKVGDHMVDVRGADIVTVKWVNNAWRYVSSIPVGKDIELNTSGEMGALMQSFEGAQ